MRCSSLADDFFRYNPGATELHLPLEYPRRHEAVSTYTDFANGYEKMKPPHPPFPGLKYKYRGDEQMAHIRAHKIREYIVPWLLGMEKDFQKADAEREKAKTSEQDPEDPPEKNIEYDPHSVTKIAIPEDLLGKIHLYNAMLQLGLPSFVRQPLIDGLVAQMYRTNLSACELDTLEMTIGRFYAHGVPVLDPVLCHFIGTYALRNSQDRQRPEPSAPPEQDDLSPTDDEAQQDDPPSPVEEEAANQKNTSNKEAQTEGDENHWDLDHAFDFSKSHRRYIDFAEFHGGRRDFPNDTFVLPPKLPVLGHSIRHWSGIRRNGSAAAAHTGLPLNAGRVL